MSAPILVRWLVLLYCILVAAAVLVFWVWPAHADQQPDAKPITWKDCTAGGTATTPYTIVAPANVRGFFLQNPSTATESIFFDTAKTASTTAGRSPELVANASVTWGPGTIFVGTLSVAAVTGGHAFVCQYGQ